MRPARRPKSAESGDHQFQIGITNGADKPLTRANECPRGDLNSLKSTCI
jgi:hypothetical protein